MAVAREIYFAAGDIMARKGRIAGIADEGGWWPVFDSNEEALETRHPPSRLPAKHRARTSSFPSISPPPNSGKPTAIGWR